MERSGAPDEIEHWSIRLRMNLPTLKGDRVFADHPPQSIKHLDQAQQGALMRHAHLGFAM